MSANDPTRQIAERLVALCREHKWEQALKELYADDATSIEPEETPGSPKETRGLPAIGEKGRKWAATIENLHHISVSDPVVAGNSFACAMRLEVTMKGKGRMDLTELCVYDVKDGKIVSEQFHR
ncbi:MAG: SnoaL-like domain-containing protein [Opitutaceae bacterium]